MERQTDPTEDERAGMLEALASIGYQGVRADAWFSIRLVRQLDALGEAGELVPSFTAAWWSMYLHEGRNVLRKKIPRLLTPMSEDASSVFETARHGLKMFLDTKRDVVGYEDYFSEIERTHNAEFIGRIWRPLRGIGRDLGIATYRERVISTTHGYAFASGLEPTALARGDMGPRLRRLWTEAGQSFAMAALAVDGPAPTILQSWVLSDFASDDYVSRDYYRSVFTGVHRPGLNAVLLHYLGMVNSVDLLFPMQHDEDVDRYSIFKMRYLTTAHVLGSLKKLRDVGIQLPPKSADHLAHLIDDAPSAVSLHRPWLRNLLVHYEPSPKADLSRIKGAGLLADVVALVDVPETIDDLSSGVEANILHLSTGLDQWMHSPDSP